MFDIKDDGKRTDPNQKYPDWYDGVRPDFSTGKTVSEILRDSNNPTEPKKPW
jgi:hypothetical protein